MRKAAQSELRGPTSRTACAGFADSWKTVTSASAGYRAASCSAPRRLPNDVTAATSARLRGPGGESAQGLGLGR